jgi:putative membrane protein
VSEAVAADAQWRRLNRRMLLIHPILELGRALPFLVGVILAGSASGRGGAWGLIGVAITLTVAMTRWFTTRYRITETQVQIRTGLLRRRVTSVSRDRVRTVDVSANALHRALGLARVTIGTGRSDRKEQELRLDGLTMADAAALRTELLHRAAPADPGAPTVPETEIARLDPRWIAYGPFTLSGIVAIGVLAGLASNAINEAHVDLRDVGPLRAILDHFSRTPLALAVGEVALGAALLVAAASTIGYVLAFWGFRLTRHPGGTLHVTRGLLTTRATSIEERRLRGVELSEPLLLRSVGGARCIAIATGLRVGRGAERGGSLLLPPAPRDEAIRVAATILRDEDPVTCPLTPHGPAARRRRFTRALAGASLVVGALVVLWRLSDWSAWTWTIPLALSPLAGVLAADRYRSLGHALAGGFLVARTGSLVRRRAMLATDGIIGFNLSRSYFQRRAGLSTLTATTAAGEQGYAVIDVDPAQALTLAEAAVPGLLDPFLERGYAAAVAGVATSASAGAQEPSAASHSRP